MNGMMKLGKKGKPSPRYIEHYKILKRVGKVAYELDFLKEIANVNSRFHILLLRKSVGDQTSIVPLEHIAMKNINYKEVPVEIINR